jgi:hypothetical protein
VAYLASYGIACGFVPVEEADIVDGILAWRGERYDCAVRYFMVTSEVTDHLDFIIALEHAKRTKLLGAYVSQLFTSKGLLADLYQDDRLTLDQRRQLDYVPWTARLRDGPARRGEAMVNPVEWAAENRERAVLKPSNLFGSRGVVVGSFVSESGWRSALDAAVREGGYIVQEQVRPDAWPCVYWHLGSESLVSVNSPTLIGPYVVDGADGGGFTKQPIKGTESELLNRNRAVSLGCVNVRVMTTPLPGTRPASSIEVCLPTGLAP